MENKKKAIVVVDVQNDFVKGGSLAYGFPKESNTDAICAYVHKNIRDGNIVIATRDTHGPNYATTLEGTKLPVLHCIEETHGWHLVPSLKIFSGVKGFKVIDKPTFGTPAVAGEIAKQIMLGNDISEIEVFGYMTSICVVANAVMLRATFPNMKITVLKDLCGDVDEESHNAALKVLANQQIDIA